MSTEQDIELTSSSSVEDCERERARLHRELGWCDELIARTRHLRDVVERKLVRVELALTCREALQIHGGMEAAKRAQGGRA